MKKDSESDPKVCARLRMTDGTFKPADLPKRRRVVVLKAPRLPTGGDCLAS